MAQARAEVAIAAQQLARAQVRAPFTGRVAKRHADPGAMLAAGTPLFTLVDDAVLEFRASVPSADYGKAQVGARVEVTVDALRRPDGEGHRRARDPAGGRAHALVRGGRARCPASATWWAACSRAPRCAWAR